jgi:DNA-binding transcriptional MerR regulator
MTAGRYGIGEFSRLSRLTVTTLRHYDDVGLLPPAAVDPATGYRSYDDEQLPVALRLGVLRSAGVPVPELVELVHGRRTLADVLARQRERVEAERAEQERRLALLDELARAPASGLAVEEVEAVELPARTVAVCRRHSTWEGAEQATRHALVRLLVTLRRRGIEPVLPSGALFPVDPEPELTVVTYAGVDVDAVGADLDVLELAAGPGLRVTHTGGHVLLAYAYRTLLAAASTRGLVPDGPVREEYLEVRPSEPARTELFLPVRRP